MAVLVVLLFQHIHPTRRYVIRLGPDQDLQSLDKHTLRSEISQLDDIIAWLPAEVEALRQEVEEARKILLDELSRRGGRSSPV